MQLNRKKQKSKAKKSGNDEDDADKIVEEHLDVLGPKPTVYDTLPFQLFRSRKASLISSLTILRNKDGPSLEVRAPKPGSDCLLSPWAVLKAPLGLITGITKKLANTYPKASKHDKA